MSSRTVMRLVAPAVLALIVAISGMPDAAAASRPSAPRSVQAKPGNGSVRVTWIPPLSDGGAPVTRYQVQRADVATGPWSIVARLAATTFAWRNTGLTNGTRYYFRVRAHNSVGWGPASAAVSAVPRTVPSAPQSPAASSGDGSATVSWLVPLSDGGAAINGYQLQYSTDGISWSNLAAGTQTQLTAGGLENGVEYRFRVRAHNTAGWGPVSIETGVTPGVPQTPVGFTATSSADGITISLSDWEPGITWFDVQVSSNGGVNWSYLPSYKGGPTDPGFSDTFTGGTLGQTYYFHVDADNQSGSSPWSSAVSAVFGLAPGPVANLTATHYGSPLFANSVSWSAPTSGTRVLGYYVDRLVNAPPYQRIATNDAAHTSYYNTGITAGNDYWYRVTPYNELGSGPSSLIEVMT